MAHRQFARGRGRLGSKRETSWFDIALTFTGIPDAGIILNSLTALELAKRPFTIVRTYLEVKILSDQAIASENQLAGIGLCVVSDQASAIGITAVPTPITDLGSDLWFVHQLVFSSFLFASAVGFVEPAGGISRTIDSRAMRKVNDAEDVLVVAESNLTLGSGLTLMVGGRLLIKEH